jgi:hypothetical protein
LYCSGKYLEQLKKKEDKKFPQDLNVEKAKKRKDVGDGPSQWIRKK